MLSSLLPISEKAEEEIERVPTYDKVSPRSSFYEKVKDPNPAYQQYNREGANSIPITMMTPKQNVETVENTLYDTVGVTDLEDEPVIVTTSKPLSVTNAVVVANEEALIYSVTKKKSKKSSTVSGFLHQCEDKDVLHGVSEELQVKDVEEEKGGPDMSIFVSKSQIKLDTKTDPGTEGDISASMDNDSDEVFSGPITDMAVPRHKQQVFRSDSIQSTTSDDRDLLDNVKLKDRSKIAHPKLKVFGNVNVASKHTPSPKAKRAERSKPSTAESKPTRPVAKDNKGRQDYEQVTKLPQPKPQQNFKPTIPHNPAVDSSLLRKGSPKLKTSHGNQVSTPSPKLTKHANPRGSPNLRKVAPTTGAYLTTSHPAQSGNPLGVLRAKSSPRVKPKSVNPAVQVDKQSEHKLIESTTVTQVEKHTQRSLGPTKETKRISLATDRLVPVTDKTDEKKRPKSESFILGQQEPGGSQTSTLSFKEKREKESEEMDQTLQDLDDLISTI